MPTVDLPARNKHDTGQFAVVLILGVGFAVLWSSAFSVAKILVTHAPPFSVSALRFFIASTLAGALALALGQRLPRGWRSWQQIIVLGLCQNTLYLGLFFAAMTSIDAGLAAIIASALPLIVAALAPTLIGERVGVVQAAGLAVGFCGVIWIMSDRILGGVSGAGVVLAILGAVALSFATLTVKRGQFGTGLLMVVACQMFVGAVGCVPIALLLEDVTAFDLQPVAIAAFVYQVVFPGIVATLVWFALVGRLTATGASAFHFLNPMLGVGFAWALLGEPLSAADAVGVALVALGILIVNRAAAIRSRFETNATGDHRP